MTIENDTRRQQLYKYLNDTYGRLAQADRDLALASNIKERVRLRAQINEYEEYLEKWHEELAMLESENPSAKVPAFTSPGVEAYLMGMARKSYALDSKDEALQFIETVRKNDPHYPGVEALEQNIRQSLNLPTNKPNRLKGFISPASGNFNYQILVATMALLLIVIVITILIVAQSGQPSAASKNNNRTNPTVRPTAPVILPPAPTDAPFLVPTPTVIIGVTDPPRPLAPTPTPTRR
jgi:hypothetical protein